MTNSTLLVGWDDEDIQYCNNEIRRIGLFYKILLMPYNRFRSEWDILGCFSEIDANTKGRIKSDMGDLMQSVSAEDYEQIMILMTRTIYGNAPNYKKFGIVREMMLQCEMIIDKVEDMIQVAIYRDWPHLLSDYIFYVVCKARGIKTVVLLPVKGLCSGFRSAWAPTGNIYYIVHDMTTKFPIELKDNDKESEILIENIFRKMLAGEKETFDMIQRSPDGKLSRSRLSTTREEHIRQFKNSRNEDRKMIHMEKQVQASRFLADLKRDYDSISVTLEEIEKACTNTHKRFIYFPLPKEPEANINPAMGINWCFTYWLEILTRETPFQIVCKEHPDTFRFSLTHCSHFLNTDNFPRYKGLYSQIINEFEHRVMFLDYNSESSDILCSGSCECVFTMNGSAIYESARYSKRAFLPDGHWATELVHCSGIREIKRMVQGDTLEALSVSRNSNCDVRESEGCSKRLFKNLVRVYNRLDNRDTLVNDIIELSEMGMVT